MNKKEFCSLLKLTIKHVKNLVCLGKMRYSEHEDILKRKLANLLLIHPISE